ncbi:unnamed protein product [Microthlaspi erraticum]|uniref:Uncharacterized protein n=1 Tax=Microthlaspi erraticum TaxID=1685480 RepID=A0A6D2L2K4_9BRAS|nr:unnamed protein product [Microthlaspi erraticum]
MTLRLVIVRLRLRWGVLLFMWRGHEDSVLCVSRELTHMRRRGNLMAATLELEETKQLFVFLLYHQDIAPTNVLFAIADLAAFLTEIYRLGVL